MTLSEIRKILANSRQNGIYFSDSEWGKGTNIIPLVYMSKKGALFLIYLEPMRGRKHVEQFSFDMENMIRSKSTLEIWEGSL